MAFENNKFSVAKKTKLPAGDFSVECNVALGADVGKILSVGVKAFEESCETLNGVLNYSGVVDLKIIFTTADGQINCSNHSCNFSSKFESDKIATGQDAVILLKVVDYVIESISGDSVRIVVNLEQSGDIVCQSEIETIACNDEDVFCKNEEIEILKLVATKKDGFTQTSEVSLRESVKKILSTESQVLLKNCESLSGFVSLQGEVLTRVVFLSEEDKFECFYVSEPFKEELEVDGCEKDDVVEAYAFIKDEKVTTQIENDDKGQKLTINIPVEVLLRVYHNELISVVDDIYSTKNEINLTTESFENSTICPLIVVEDKIEGSLNLDEDAPRVDKVLFASGNGVSLTNVYVNDGQIFVEGIAKTNVIYLNDETSSLNSAAVDVPFAFSDKFDCQCDGFVMASAMISDVDVVVKKGRDLYYDAKIKVDVNCSYDRISSIISKAEILDVLPERDYAMEVLFAQSGQSAWEIAKSAHVPLEQVVAQNPEATFPLEEETSLVLFYQKG